MNREAFREASGVVGLSLTASQLDQFEAFEEKLYLANEVMNLTRVPREECWVRHFLDGLLFQDLIPPGSSVLDIGTGPGFPAWPLACPRPDLTVTALDSKGKMLDFLRENPLENLTVVECRAEEFASMEKFDVITGRAVAPLAIQLEISASPCRIGGLVMPMRTSADELAARSFNAGQLGLELDRIESRSLPGGAAVRLFPVYRKVRSTPKEFPRAWADIKRRPLN